MADHYYHFIRTNGDGKPYLGNNDNRVVEVGEPVTVEGEPVLCQHGLHASKRILDALEYCPEGEVALCRVELGGEVLHDTDKSVAQTRTIIAMLGAEGTATLLREFARWCALSVVHLWDAPDIVRQYLETGDESLSEAAREAAAAGEAAAWSAAWAAAGEAAAWSAAWAAAGEAAAWAAAGEAAAWSAAWAAAGEAAAWAARAAAGEAAAWAAARVESKQAQEEKLVQLFEAAEGGREP